MSFSMGGGAITTLLGTVLLRLTITGDYKRYVRVGMGPWLLIAGVVLVLLGGVVVVRLLRGADDHSGIDRSGNDRSGNDHSGNDHGDHDHGGGAERAGWLLLAPIAALLLVAPPTLGSYGVDAPRRWTSAADPPSSTACHPPPIRVRCRCSSSGSAPSTIAAPASPA